MYLLVVHRSKISLSLASTYIDLVIGCWIGTTLLYIYIIEALIIVHSEPPAVLTLPDPVAEDSLLVADAEGQISGEL